MIAGATTMAMKHSATSKSCMQASGTRPSMRLCHNEVTIHSVRADQRRFAHATYSAGMGSVQNLQRVAAMGMSLRHCGQVFVEGGGGGTAGSNFASRYFIGTTIRK